MRTAYKGTPGVYTAPDFRFGTGENLPALKLHYVTLGTPHRGVNGQVDNAVLLLHGTGGDAHSSLHRSFQMCCSAPDNRWTSRSTT